MIGVHRCPGGKATVAAPLSGCFSGAGLPVDREADGSKAAAQDVARLEGAERIERAPGGFENAKASYS